MRPRRQRRLVMAGWVSRRGETGLESVRQWRVCTCRCCVKVDLTPRTILLTKNLQTLRKRNTEGKTRVWNGARKDVLVVLLLAGCVVLAVWTVPGEEVEGGGGDGGGGEGGAEEEGEGELHCCGWGGCWFVGGGFVGGCEGGMRRVTVFAVC